MQSGRSVIRAKRPIRSIDIALDMKESTTRASVSTHMATDTIDARCFDHHTDPSTRISIKSPSLIVHLSKEPPVNALQAAMLCFFILSYFPPC